MHSYALARVNISSTAHLMNFETGLERESLSARVAVKYFNMKKIIFIITLYTRLFQNEQP